MKNLHILRTNKPSRLVKIKNNLFYTTTKNISAGIYQNIYITNSEEIKEGDKDFYIIANDRDKTWINRLEKVVECKIDPKHGKVLILSSGFLYVDEGEKIILTTDQDLIKDDVQAIDDEFLQWFVNNPNCEHVEVEKCGYMPEEPYDYKIIIPKEECKLELDCPYDFTSRCTMGRCNCKPKQETLEEAAERLYPVHKMYFPTSVEDLNKIPRSIFISGAKWMQERMYSEEEVLTIIDKYQVECQFKYNTGTVPDGREWFEQFKKKV